MKILGIIAEYNPFHLGHQYHLQKAKELTNADGIICIMSSAFVQRGEPALVDKWARCEMALKAGVDLVLELPTVFASRSAYWFALGSIKSLAATGIITHLAFGAENANLNKLKEVATILNRESDTFKLYLEKYLNNGHSYPKARSLTLEKILNTDKEMVEELNNPNNILAIAYLRILQEINSNIQPIVIKRIGKYHSQFPQSGIASATAIRKMIKENNSSWKNYVPLTTQEILEKCFSQNKGPVFLNNLEQSILATIRRMNTGELKNIIEVEEGLENRIWELAQKHGDIFSLITDLKTKRYTYTRIQRLLLHTLLNFQKNLAFTNPHYLRILGFSPFGQELLKTMKPRAELPIITKFAKGFNELNENGMKMLTLEAQASDLYNLAYSNTEMRIGRQDFYQSPIRLTNGPMPSARGLRL